MRKYLVTVEDREVFGKIYRDNETREELPPGAIVVTREQAIKQLKTIGISTGTHYVAEILDELFGPENEAIK